MQHALIKIPAIEGGELELLRDQVRHLQRCLDDLRVLLLTPPDPIGGSKRESRDVPVDSQRIRLIIRERRRRERELDPQLFADPAWDILLETFEAELKQRRLSVSDLCVCAAVPTTTALRWLRKLEQDGWLVRERDTQDGRRQWVELSQEASTKLRRYFDRNNMECI